MVEVEACLKGIIQKHCVDTIALYFTLLLFSEQGLTIITFLMHCVRFLLILVILSKDVLQLQINNAFSPSLLFKFMTHWILVLFDRLTRYTTANCCCDMLMFFLNCDCNCRLTLLCVILGILFCFVVQSHYPWQVRLSWCLPPSM